jgi:hypothetical protein
MLPHGGGRLLRCGPMPKRSVATLMTSSCALTDASTLQYDGCAAARLSTDLRSVSVVVCVLGRIPDKDLYSHVSDVAPGKQRAP